VNDGVIHICSLKDDELSISQSMGWVEEVFLENLFSMILDYNSMPIN
jgi:hypothetical protein